jgi:hypothetical protein
MSSMFNPPHPGLTLRGRHPCLHWEKLFRSARTATQLGVDRAPPCCRQRTCSIDGRRLARPVALRIVERWSEPDRGGAAGSVWLARRQAACRSIASTRPLFKASKALARASRP